MAPRRERVVVLVLLLGVILLGYSPVAKSLDRAIGDWHFQWLARRHRAPFPDDLLVVAIDDATVKSFGKRLKYWSRSEYAKLIERASKASAVGIDIVLSDPDPVDADGDRRLAEAVRRHGRVVLGFFVFGGEVRLGSGSQARLAAMMRRMPTVPPGGLRWSGRQIHEFQLEPPLPSLAEGAAALGFLDLEADPDGVYRRPWMVLATDTGHILPSFAAAVASVATNTPLAEAVARAPEVLQNGGRSVPLVAGSAWLRPLARRSLQRGPGQPVPTMSFADALRADPAVFAGKIVLVGETATGTTDKRPNPLDPGLTGVELNADILANVLHTMPAEPLPELVAFALAAFAVVLPTWFFLGLAPRRAMLLAAVLAILLVAALEAAFWLGRFLPAWSPVLLGVFGSSLVVGLQRLVSEERRRAELRRNFSLYVAPEVVAQIVDNPELAGQQGVRQDVCVLFSDIRGFTAYCERTEPERVVEQVTEYLTAMTDCVIAYRGVLDKFVGDAVMALFGPFCEPDVNRSALGCACAMEMLQRLDELNAGWAERGWDQLKIGIGLHRGEAIVGNIGSAQRTQYTALGDTVNAAARLEALTKELAATLLVTEEVRAEAAPLLGERVRFVPQGTFTVRNRERPLVVFELAWEPAAAGRRTDAD